MTVHCDTYQVTPRYYHAARCEHTRTRAGAAARGYRPGPHPGFHAGPRWRAHHTDAPPWLLLILWVHSLPAGQERLFEPGTYRTRYTCCNSAYSAWRCTNCVFML